MFLISFVQTSINVFVSLFHNVLFCSIFRNDASGNPTGLPSKEVKEEINSHFMLKSKLW